MSAAAGYSGNQRRVLAELGLATMRPRVAVDGAVENDLVLHAETADDVLLAAILAWMPDGAVTQEDGKVRLRLPKLAGDGLGAIVDTAGLRRHPDWKCQLWQRQRRLRRSSGG